MGGDKEMAEDSGAAEGAAERPRRRQRETPQGQRTRQGHHRQVSHNALSCDELCKRPSLKLSSSIIIIVIFIFFVNFFLKVACS